MVITRMLALAGIGLTLGAADSWIRPVQLRLKPPEPAPTSTAPATTPADTTSPATSTATPAPPANADGGAGPTAARQEAVLGQEITLEQAKGLFDRGIVFIDARLGEEFIAERIQGALHLTAAMFGQSEPPRALEILDPAAPLVIYCSGGDCDASHSVGIRLQQSGYENLHIMTVGFAAWKQAGYPTESGADPLDNGG